MTISWNKNERRLYYRNPQFRSGRKNWSFGEGRVVVFHPLFPGETLTRMNMDINMGVEYDDSRFPIEYELGAWIVKAGDMSIQNAIDVWTANDELRSSSDNQTANDLMSDSQATGTGQNMLDLYVKQLIIKGAIQGGDDEWADTFYDMRGSDNEPQYAHWNAAGLRSTHKEIWSRRGWLRNAGVNNYDSSARDDSPVGSIKMRTNKDYKIWEPSFLVIGAFLPKLRVEEKFNWFYVQPGGTGNLAQSGFGSNQNLWNPEVVERIINSGIVDTFGDAENAFDDFDTADDEGYFAWYMTKLLQGDNYIESDTFPSSQPGNDHGWIALRGSAGVRTPINSMPLRVGNQYAS